MHYCFSYTVEQLKEGKNQQFPMLLQDSLRAIEENKYLYFNSNTNQFYDDKGKPISIEKKQIQPIGSVKQAEQITMAIEKMGGSSTTKIEDRNKIQTWYEYYTPHRFFISLKGSQIKSLPMVEYLCSHINEGSVFIKTKKKDFNGFVPIYDLINEDSYFRKALEYHMEEDFLISEIVAIDEDNMGKKEYRVVVKNGEVMNISRITELNYHRIEPSVYNFARSLAQQLPNTFPKNYVVDLFQYHNGIVDVVEFNSFGSSAKYLYNSIFTKSTDMLHTNVVTSIPKERRRESLGFNNQEYFESSLTMSEGSFSKDITEIKKYGKRIDGYVSVHGYSGELFNLFDIDDITMIESIDYKSEIVAEKQKQYLK